jgi:hypothetical protein
VIEAGLLGMTVGSMFVLTLVAGLDSILLAWRRLKLRHHRLTLRSLERETWKLWRADRPKKAAVFCSGCLKEMTPVPATPAVTPTPGVLNEVEVEQMIGLRPRKPATIGIHPALRAEKAR